jgi:hypothetical protein
MRGARCSAVAAGLRRPQVDAQGQDAVDQLSFGVADHGEICVVALGLLAEALSFGTLDRWHPALLDGVGPLPKTRHHLVGVKHRHDGQRRGGVRRVATANGHARRVVPLACPAFAGLQGRLVTGGANCLPDLGQSGHTDCTHYTGEAVDVARLGGRRGPGREERTGCDKEFS